MASFYLRELIFCFIDEACPDEFEFRGEKKKLKMILTNDIFPVSKQRKVNKRLQEN